MADVDATLNERESSHGRYVDHASGSQRLKDALHSNPGWAQLTPTQKEALEMIVHKMARILAGNPDFPDHWHDIGGYARLCELELL